MFNDWPWPYVFLRSASCGRHWVMVSVKSGSLDGKPEETGELVSVLLTEIGKGILTHH